MRLTLGGLKSTLNVSRMALCGDLTVRHPLSLGDGKVPTAKGSATLALPGTRHLVRQVQCGPMILCRI